MSSIPISAAVIVAIAINIHSLFIGRQYASTWPCFSFSHSLKSGQSSYDFGSRSFYSVFGFARADCL